MQKKKIVFELCKKKDLINVIYALKNWANKNHILSRSQKLLDFQHKLKDSYSFILAKKSNKVIGILGYIPTYIYDSSLQEDLQYSTVTWFINLRENISGLGFSMFRTLLNIRKASFCYALAMTSNAFAIHKLLGFKTGYMSHAFIANPSIKKFKIMINPPLIKKLSKNNNFFLKKIEKSFFDFETKNLECSFDIVPTKSVIYFKNRYLKHPYYNYKIFGVFEGSKIKGLLSLRVVSYKKTKIVRLVDFIGTENSIEQITYDLQILLKHLNAEYLDFYFFGLNKIFLKKAGFILLNSKSKTIIPNYFEPYIESNIKINIAYRFSKKNDKRKVRLFKGDADQDRPNAINYR